MFSDFAVFSYPGYCVFRLFFLKQLIKEPLKQCQLLYRCVIPLLHKATTWEKPCYCAILNCHYNPTLVNAVMTSLKHNFHSSWLQRCMNSVVECQMLQRFITDIILCFSRDVNDNTHPYSTWRIEAGGSSSYRGDIKAIVIQHLHFTALKAWKNTYTLTPWPLQEK